MVSCLCLNACSPACSVLAAEDNCPVASLETNMGYSALTAAANNDFLARDKTRMNNNTDNCPNLATCNLYRGEMRYLPLLPVSPRSQ